MYVELVKSNFKMLSRSHALSFLYILDVFVAVTTFNVKLQNPPKSLQQNEVRSLPGLDQPLKSKHYSGLVRVNSTAYTFPWKGRNELVHTHYYFIEAEERNPEEAPLVVWLQGTQSQWHDAVPVACCLRRTRMTLSTPLPWQFDQLYF